MNYKKYRTVQLFRLFSTFQRVGRVNWSRVHWAKSPTTVKGGVILHITLIQRAQRIILLSPNFCQIEQRTEGPAMNDSFSQSSVVFKESLFLITVKERKPSQECCHWSRTGCLNSKKRRAYMYTVHCMAALWEWSESLNK